MIFDGRGDYDLGGVWGGRDDTLVSRLLLTDVKSPTLWQVWPNEDLMNSHHSDYYANRLHSDRKPSWTAFLGHKEIMAEPAWDQHESWGDHGRWDEY